MIERQLKEQGIHGPPYRLLYGNTKEIMKMARETGSKPMSLSHDIMPRLNPFLHKAVMDYGKVMVIWYGTTPRVTITDPMLVKEILSNKSGDFGKMEITAFAKLFLTGLANHDGQKWAEHRRIINPAFHLEKLKLMLPAFSISCDELIGRWEKLVELGGSCELDVYLQFQNLTGDVISRAAFGSSFEEGRQIFLLQKEQGELFLRAHSINNFPWLRFLPTKVNTRMREIYRQLGVLLRGIIEKRQKAIQMGNNFKDDLLSLLLESNLNDPENKNSKNMGLTTEDVIDECKLFYLAGHETTTNLLTWTMVVLGMHPTWQARAREEVLHVLGTKKPNFDDLGHLKIVTMILHEVLRLYPPTSLLRRTHNRTKLGEIFLPSGIQLFLPINFVHYDPEQWGEDATEFNPERFSKGVSKASKDNSYFPFGWGPRICIGQNFAMVEAKMALARILQHFSFELSPSYSHAPCTILTLQPQYGAQVILHKL
ncbi:hypothetical protein HHK36_003664 [Tetracentron sinense]|uniref:Cytochrome P450 n=1 Tax=Tetracentron sinense TaxID=13715 RepID=A0A834ZPG1_TETSI|nr:hypothetical protein HHK36_003664 [Tetracentron sinense]